MEAEQLIKAVDDGSMIKVDPLERVYLILILKTFLESDRVGPATTWAKKLVYELQKHKDNDEPEFPYIGPTA